MRKLVNFILAALLLSVAITSCSGDSYAKKLDNEKKNIKDFLKEHSISVLSEFPEGRKFAANEYYLDGKTGIYLHVIDSGYGQKAVKAKGLTGGSRVFMRYDSLRYVADPDTVVWSNMTTQYPLMLEYGNTSTYKKSSSTNEEYTALSPACALALEWVREGAEVKLIVPFLQGSSMQENSYAPLYYGRLKYVSMD